ncbi:MAG: GNAT family N-acetyltransferase [bacterium]
MMTTLRDLTKSDLETLVRWRCDPRVNRHLSPRLTELEEAERWLEQVKSNPSNWLFAICEGEKLIGYAGVESVHQYHRRCELAMVIGEPEYWGRGIAGEVIRAMLKYAFEELELHRVWAAVVRGNERSERLVKSAGFTYEGTMREAMMISGEFTDLLHYSILDREYAALRS